MQFVKIMFFLLYLDHSSRLSGRLKRETKINEMLRSNLYYTIIKFILIKGIETEFSKKFSTDAFFSKKSAKLNYL